jgi:hypothetical protein
MSLKNNDLRDLVDKIIEIDSYKSKMGSDEDIITLAFSTKTKESANDLVGFIERGYSFVLDADATSGEQSDGTYKVFVEMERDKHAPEYIIELAGGVSNLTGLDDVKFRYYKNFRSKPLTQEALEEMIPTSSEDYGLKVTESNLENYKNFFNKSFVEDVHMEDNMLVIKKAYADPLAFEFVDFGPTQQTLDAINESFNANDFAEIIFLSKYVGDYNITKYGQKLAFENDGNTLVLERIMI